MTDENSEGKRYRVVDILSPTRLVLNCGSIDNIASDTTFRIFAYGNEITDPETQEVLGKVYLPRGYGKVVVVQRKLCTIESTGKTTSGLVALMQPPKMAPFLDAQIGDFAQIVSTT
jgi:hypothetical protein